MPSPERRRVGMSLGRLGAAVIATCCAGNLAVGEDAVVSVERLNVREGPGIGFRIRDIVREGRSFDILAEEDGWCRIDNFPGAAWVNCRFLDRRPSGAENPAQQSEVRAVVCFYAEPLFGGPSFCIRPPYTEPRMPVLDNEVSSLAVSPGTEVLICIEPRLRASCLIVRSDQPRFHRKWEDDISSFAVRWVE